MSQKGKKPPPPPRPKPVYRPIVPDPSQVEERGGYRPRPPKTKPNIK